MRYLLAFVAALSFLVFACDSKKNGKEHEHLPDSKTDLAAKDTIRKSIPKEEHALIGNTHFTIKYTAPAVRDRTIWGGLVPYGEVWVTGAHAATSIEFDKGIFVNDIKVPAGKYALFTIPQKERWTIIINKNWDQHLTDEYDIKEDVLRFETTPQVLSDVQERLRYSVVPVSGLKASIEISWEKLKVSIPVGVEQ
jgi:hypothetical protein